MVGPLGRKRDNGPFVVIFVDDYNDDEDDDDGMSTE